MISYFFWWVGGPMARGMAVTPVRERERESDVTLSSVGVAVGLGRAESGCGFPHSSLPFFNFVLPPLGLCQRRRRIIPVEKNNPVGRLDFWPSNGWIDDPSFPCRPFELGLANSNPLSLSLSTRVCENIPNSIFRAADRARVLINRANYWPEPAAAKHGLLTKNCAW